MKVSVVIIALLVAVCIVSVRQVHDEQSKNTILTDSITELVKYQHWKDSIYWAHIGRCSFIKYDGIRIGYDDYLQAIKPTKPIE